MITDLFRKKKYATISFNTNSDKDNQKSNESKQKISESYPQEDDKLWIKCGDCGEMLLIKDVEKNLKTCPKCNKHFRLGARKRIDLLIDKDTFIEYDKELVATNPLEFPRYDEKIDKAKKKSFNNEAVITGEGKIKGVKSIIAVMDPDFMMGSMGSAVGEKITRAIEKAIEKRLPVIIFSASGGARMQEGILSLMQMAKTSAALNRLAEKGLVYISVLTDPTTGGVTASFAMLGDIIISEPKTLIGFAGPRVIEQTIKQQLPEGFQRAEFLKEKGFVDKIIHRKNLKEMLYKILYIHTIGGENNE